MKTALVLSLLLALAPRVEAAPDARAGSVYLLKGTLTDTSGKPVSLDLFRGEPVLISMFYGSCPQACPLLITRMKMLEAKLTPAARAQLRVVLVSFDPERDTPEKLKQLLTAHAVDPKRWVMLRAPNDDVRDLAAALDIKYHRLNTGAIWHTSVITVLDRQGQIVARGEGPDAPLEPLAAEVEKLAAAR
jgi:protein SCO1/2